MKKVSLVALAVALTSSAAMAADAPCPKAFQGFHLGGNIGYGIGKGKEKNHRNNGLGDRSGSKTDLGLNGVDGGIGTGYTHRFNNWALGLAFDANWANTSGKRRGFDSLDGGPTEGGTSRHVSHKARLQNSLQLYAKTGYVICEKTMPFIALGWDNSSWKNSIRTVEADAGDSSTVSGSKKKRLNGFLWKVGVDFLATRHFVLGLEYTGTIAGKQSLSRNVNGDVSKASFKPQYNKFAMTARFVY